MDLAEHFGTIWRRKWRILIVTVLIVGLVFAWRKTRPKVFSASALLSVSPARTSSSPIGSKDDVQFLAGTYASLATTRPVVEAAVSASRVPVSVEEAQSLVSTNTARSPGFIELVTKGKTPAEAQRLGAALTDSLIAAVRAQQAAAKSDDVSQVDVEATRVAQQLAALPANSPERSALQAQYDALISARVDSQVRPVDRLLVVAVARSSNVPISPRPLRDATLALIIVLIVNSELVVLLESLSDRFSATDESAEISDLTGLPVLARIPRGSDEDSLEEIRTLRAALMLTSTTLRSVAIVGAEQGSGKSFVSRRLSIETAAMNIPVLLIDADLRRPTVHTALTVPRSPGLSELLAGASPEDTIHPVPDHPSLRVVPAGGGIADPGSLLTGAGLRVAMRRVDWPELVIVDTPAATFFADAVAVASQCDVTVVVVNTQRSRRRTVRKLVEQLRQAGANPIGVVVNWAENTTRSAAYYYGNGQRVSV